MKSQECIPKKIADREELLAELRKLPGAERIIAIDGRCAAGKTTLAAWLSEKLGGDVIHMDDFFLPPMLRTKERSAEAGGNVHYERFISEVLPQLKERKSFSYQRFDCSKMELGNQVPVKNKGIVLVEGAYSCHPVFGDYMDRKVFLDIDRNTQEERILFRNGKERLQDFKEKWIPMEEAYFAAFSIEEHADYFIKPER